MRISLYSVMFAWLLLPAWADAAEIRNNGKIDSVVVYSDRAAVSRLVAAEFGGGQNTLTMEDVPAGVDDNSIRVTATASASITIQNVDVAVKQLAGHADPKIQTLVEKIDALQEKGEPLNIRMEARKAQIEFLKTLAQNRAKGAGKDLASSAPVSKPTPQELAEMLELVFEKRLGAENDMLSIQRERKILNDQIDQLRRELAQTQGVGARRTKNITITFAASGAGKGKFRVEYMLSGAWWSPVYVVRGDSEKKTVAVSYGANIGQRTGEDWNHAKISLSTARPVTGAKAPQAQPWVVGVQEPRMYAKDEMSRAGNQPARKMQVASPPASAPMEMDKLASAEEEEVMEGKQAVAAVKASGHVVNFEIAQRADIPSGGDVKKVSVAQLSFQAEMSYVCSPAMSQNVFMRSKALNNSEFPMLPGEVAVFQAESFVGKSMMETVAPRQMLELDLGVDPSFKVERKLVKREAGTEGLISTSKTSRLIYETEIQNFKKSRETVEVTDRLPLSRDERLTLEDVALSPKPDRRDERNIVTWKLDMRPGRKEKIRMEFTMTHSAELRPYGF
ncbi:MAG: mucoidy inhibitor MuiA family protein [Nitrospinota bacterium]|nr:mucoidy inhibitor MuiA family protein [Nitrospinota bacterium]